MFHNIIIRIYNKMLKVRQMLILIQKKKILKIYQIDF